MKNKQKEWHPATKTLSSLRAYSVFSLQNPVQGQFSIFSTVFLAGVGMQLGRLALLMSNGLGGGGGGYSNSYVESPCNWLICNTLMYTPVLV